MRSALIFDLRVSLLGWDQAPCSIKTIIRRRFSEQNASKDTEIALTACLRLWLALEGPFSDRGEEEGHVVQLLRGSGSRALRCDYPVVD